MSSAAARSFSSWTRVWAGSWQVGLLSACCLLASAGCGSEVSHGDRVPLSGTVTIKGQPLDVPATIYFDPLSGQTGVGSSCGVSGGKFTASEETGPTPGLKYKVTLITAPGIPPEGTPREQMKIAETYEESVEVPARDAESVELNIDFDTKIK